MNSRRAPPVKALAFDVFGTVVDWRASIVREGRALGARRGLRVDWGAFADAWRGGYAPAMDRVRRGELPWTPIDGLHRMLLDELIPRFGLESLTEAERVELNLVWHRLRPWPDAVRGLKRLKRGYVISTLSNGNVALLVDMARNARLPWDMVCSAELFRHYKPDPEAYRGTARLLDCAPAEVLMVAAHKSDLDGAARAGLRTAFVARPLEHGPAVTLDVEPESRFDLNARDFEDLATKLGC